MEILKRKTSSNRCMNCKEALIISSRIYCSRLEEYVDDVVYCPYFEPKPVVKLQTAV